jgi:copper ion binding protein
MAFEKRPVNSGVSEQIASSQKEENSMEKIKIQGMSCQHCVMSVTKALGSMPGVKSLKVDLVKGEATFENTQNVPMANIRRAIEDAGYKVME